MTTVTVNNQARSAAQAVTLRFVLGIVLSVVSGVLLLLAFPPYGLWPLIWVACVPYRYAQHRLLPLKWSSLAESTALLVWLGPFMARMFGMDNGPFFYFLGVFIAILVFLPGSRPPLSGNNWLPLVHFCMVLWPGLASR